MLLKTAATARSCNNNNNKNSHNNSHEDDDGGTGLSTGLPNSTSCADFLWVELARPLRVKNLNAVNLTSQRKQNKKTVRRCILSTGVGYRLNFEGTSRRCHAKRAVQDMGETKKK